MNANKDLHISPHIIKSQIELKIALFFAFGFSNDITIRRISLQCTITITYKHTNIQPV